MSSSENNLPWLILVNPASGTKLAGKMFKSIVKPSLDEKRVHYEVMETEYAGHAMNWIKETSDLNFRYSGIITISGDGLIHEVYNGLWQRRDWEDMCDFPLGIVPGGSGNALNCSLLRQLGQPLDGTQHLGATWSGCNVAQGASEKKTVALDLMEVDLADGQKRISFFGVTIGLVADVDIGSEALRCVGWMRAYILVAMRILLPKYYRVKVSYLPLSLDAHGQPIPVPPKEPPLSLPRLSEPVPPSWVSIEDNFYLVYASNLSLLDPMTLLAPDSRVDDGIIYLVLVRSTMRRYEMIHWFIDAAEGGHIGKTGVEVIPVRAFRIDPLQPRDGYMTIDAENVDFGPSQGQILPSKGRLLVSDQKP